MLYNNAISQKHHPTCPAVKYALHSLLHNKKYPQYLYSVTTGNIIIIIIVIDIDLTQYSYKKYNTK